MIKSFEIKNDYLSCKILNYGATISDLVYNNRHVVLRFSNLENYTKRNLNQAFGSTVGRVANRIDNGKLFLNNQEYDLEKNDGPNCLHSGSNNFAHKLWTVVEHTDDKLILQLNSPHLDSGFPGNVNVIVKFSLDKSNLLINYTASLDDKQVDRTVVNLTNHTYFNLDGCEAAELDNLNTNTILDHELYSPDSIAILEQKPDTKIPTKRLIRLEDADSALQINKNFIKLKDGCMKGFYDNSFVLESNVNNYKTRFQFKNKPNAYLLSRKSNILLGITTDNFSLHVYTGPRENILNYSPLTGCCLEAQSFIDACNVPEWFDQCLVTKERPYSRVIKFSFHDLKDFKDF